MLNFIFGSKNDRELKQLLPIVKKIESFEQKLKTLNDEQLKNQTVIFKERIKKGETLDSLLPEAFATVREASVRVLKMRHFDVQMMGGIVLYRGQIAEMKTGEGKTLTATLPLYLVALEGKGAHCVTVNDYLAERDATEMGILFSFLGLTTGKILTPMSDKERQDNYACDITYGTNNEFGFDYLRDNMKFDLADYVQRPHHFCIVDEVDSILIDEARTPLIISGPSEGNTELYERAAKLIPRLQPLTHYTIDEKQKSAIFTEQGIIEIQKMLHVENLFQIEHMDMLHALNQGLKAFAIFKLDVDYVVKDGKIIIVDEFTGRLKTGSRWSDGLHQAVEAKEGVPVKQENQTLASITFQNYFKLYQKLSGMTGTALTEAEEFRKIYNLDVVAVPTNKPMIRADRADIIYKSRKGKHKAICKLISELHQKGQPVLVGTISIDSSEIISQELAKSKIPHQVLNAKQHEREATIIADAGQKGAVTIATNMAGRGTDIKLTPETVSLGGLFILGTERHESRRIDNQLRGRSGRQGDPGESRFFLSLEDDLLRIFGNDRLRNVMHMVGMKEDEPIESKLVSKQIEKAQVKVEAHHFDIRKHLLDYDNVMNEQRRVIYRIRRSILNDEDNLGFCYEMLEDVCEQLAANANPLHKKNLDDIDFNKLRTESNECFGVDLQLTPQDCASSGALNEDNPVAWYLHLKARQVLKDKLDQYPEDQVKLALKELLLSVIDNKWKDHLLSMDHLREGINLQAYAQKDPLSEYKHQSFALFENMRKMVKQMVIMNLFRVRLYTPEEMEELRRKHIQELEARMKAHQEMQERIRREEELKAQANAGGNAARLQRGKTLVGRNDPCPCGSQKKYKHCHGA